jgi:hypothetical protein
MAKRGEEITVGEVKRFVVISHEFLVLLGAKSDPAIPTLACFTLNQKKDVIGVAGIQAFEAGNGLENLPKP